MVCNAFITMPGLFVSMSTRTEGAMSGWTRKPSSSGLSIFTKERGAWSRGTTMETPSSDCNSMSERIALPRSTAVLMERAYVSNRSAASSDAGFRPIFMPSITSGMARCSAKGENASGSRPVSAAIFCRRVWISSGDFADCRVSMSRLVFLSRRSQICGE